MPCIDLSIVQKFFVAPFHSHCYGFDVLVPEINLILTRNEKIIRRFKMALNAKFFSKKNSIEEPEIVVPILLISEMKSCLNTGSAAASITQILRETTIIFH